MINKTFPYVRNDVMTWIVKNRKYNMTVVET